MVYITNYGMLYKMSNAKYEKLLKDIAVGKGEDLRHYGTLISTEAINITDVYEEQAQEMLENLKRHKRITGFVRKG